MTPEQATTVATRIVAEHTAQMLLLGDAYPQQSFGAVTAVQGVEGMISDAKGPVAFPSHWIEDFRTRHMRGEWDYCRQGPVPVVNKEGEPEVRFNPAYPIGARVEVMAGEFADMLATITGKEGRRGKTVVFKVKDANQYGRLHISDVQPAWDWNKRATAAA